MFSYMHKKRLGGLDTSTAFCFLLLISTLCSAHSSLALTTGTIVGKVVDRQTDEAMPGANVIIKGTNMGAASGPDGNFTITNVPPGAYTVVASFIGYHSEKTEVHVVVNEEATANFSLELDVFRGEDVVVTGLASRTSKAVAEVTVGRIQAKELTELNTYQTTQQLINGKIAGVSVRTSSGNVGAGFRFNIRSGGGLNGDEQPVIYLDGVRLENSQFVGFGVGGQGISVLADLNPEDIENIEILKGPAAAASFGTNGANGVVLITTKKGRLVASGSRKMTIDYKTVVGWNTQSFDYDDEDFLTFQNANAAIRTGNVVQNTISMSGGSNTVRYFTSFDSRVEDGIINRNKLNRKSIRTNFDIIPNDKLTVRVNANYSYSTNERPDNDNNILGFLGNTLLFSFPFAFTDSSAIEAIDNTTTNNRFIGSLQAEWTPFKGFTGRLNIGIDDNDIRQNETFPVSENFGVGQLDDGQRSIFTRRTRLFTYNMDGRYTFSPLKDLTLSAVGGLQIFDRRFNNFFTTKFEFLTDLITNIGAGAQLQSADENFNRTREAGIFGEVNLSFKDQYFLTGGLRRDYATTVGVDASSIFYPKASAAVRLDKYDWFPSLFGLMKVRAAYGETGILPNLLDGIPLLFTAENGGFGAGGVISQIGNAEVEPERVKEIELGFDTEFLDRYAFEFTYYNLDVEDSIIPFRNAPSTGQTASDVPFNIGNASGWGLETLLQASLIRSRNFRLDLTLINNFQDNEIDDLGGAQPIFDGFDINVIKEGLRKHEFFTIPVFGATFDENGVYTGPDTPENILDNRVARGNPVAHYTGSFSLNFRLFKNLNIYLLTDWSTGLSVFNNTDLFAARFGNKPRFNELATQLGIAGGGPGNVAGFTSAVDGVEELTPGTPEYIAAADEFARLDHRFDYNYVEDADFFKLRELSVSYSLRDILPKIFGRNSYLRDLVIAFSGTNLFTSTKYSGADPEINFAGSRSLIRGQDFLTLQNPKTYNLSFRFSL